MTPVSRPVFLAGLLLLVAAPLKAQERQQWDPQRAYATRESLEELHRRLVLSAESPAYSPTLRRRAREQAERIKHRLDQGDFQVGDRVFLFVQNEQQLSDTFTVRAGPALDLPVIGMVPLTGVLRAEAEPYLSGQIGRFVRAPVVRAQTLVRIAIFGEVGRPGFYVVPSEALVTDALMMAGGPTRTARLTDVRVEREDRRITGGAGMQTAIFAGQTLDQIGIRAGDHLVVPRQRGGILQAHNQLRAISALIALPAAIFGLTRLF